MRFSEMEIMRLYPRHYFLTKCRNPLYCILYSFIDCFIRCVRFNFRKLLRFFKDCKTKLILFKYLRLREMTQWPMLPEEAHLMKTGLRNRQPGCDCILEVIRQMGPRYLDQLFQRLEQRERIRNGDFLTSYFYLSIDLNYNIPFSCHFNLQNKKDQILFQISTMQFRFLRKIGHFFCKS